MAHDPNRRKNEATMVSAELAIRAARRTVEAMPKDKQLFRAIDLLDRAAEAVSDHIDGVTFLERFSIFQAERDFEQECRDYVAKAAVRLIDSEAKTVREWPLAALPGFPRETPYVVAWDGRHWRLGAQTAAGIIPGGTHGFDYEILFGEITDKDPLRDYEREECLYRLPETA